MLSLARKIIFMNENIANNEFLSNIAHLIITRKYKKQKRGKMILRCNTCRGAHAMYDVQCLITLYKFIISINKQ